MSSDALAVTTGQAGNGVRLGQAGVGVVNLATGGCVALERRGGVYSMRMYMADPVCYFLWQRDAARARGTCSVAYRLNGTCARSSPTLGAAGLRRVQESAEEAPTQPRFPRWVSGPLGCSDASFPAAIHRHRLSVMRRR